MAKSTHPSSEASPAGDKAKRPPDVGPGPELEPLFAGPLEGVLVLGSIAVAAGVALRFDFDVNRVFDVPKAQILKAGGAAILGIWLVNALFFRGVAGRSVRVFAGPVMVLLSSIVLSAIFSIDPWMSWFGVYERQFGVQGALACVGLFLATSTGIRSRRGAVMGLSTLAVIGGVMGFYAWIQAHGWDPYGFFPKPANKVYATLGNATFAGNALALIFPVSLLLAITSSAVSLSKDRQVEAKSSPKTLVFLWATGFVLTISLALVPAYLGRSDAGLEVRQSTFRVMMAIAVVSVIFLASCGRYGLEFTRLESPAGRAYADAAASGALSAWVLGIALALVATRTRGAWVGTAFAIAGGALLLPALFRENAAVFAKVRVYSLIGLGVLVAALVSFLVFWPQHLIARTIFSIPKAFDSKVTTGKGQGTRRYLWVESPLVLVDHEKTLARQDRDRRDFLRFSERDEGDRDPPREANYTWRKILVWPFGVGFEAYRYAFMSHKSKALERLDQMTNHDNPHNNYLYVLVSCGLFGLAAYVWLLLTVVRTAWRQFTGESGSRAYRALAFGVLTSFFSYSVYSIAGFDSVACSVFLYLLLGCAAALFAPSQGEPPKPLGVHLLSALPKFRGLSAPERAPLAMDLVILVIGLGLCGHTMWGVQKIVDAERAFVGETRPRSLHDKIANIERAISINKNESFYKTSLGGTYTDMARQFRALAVQAQREQQPEEAKGFLAQAQVAFGKAEKALHLALDHAWAPENIFISLFQLYYGWQKMEDAERALERALEHSPHLAPVRANLAVIELEDRQAVDDAIKNCLWVLEIDPQNATGLRTCGRGYFLQGDMTKAKTYLDQAAVFAPADPLTRRFLKDLETSSTIPAIPLPSPG